MIMLQHREMYVLEKRKTIKMRKNENEKISTDRLNRKGQHRSLFSFGSNLVSPSIKVILFCWYLVTAFWMTFSNEIYTTVVAANNLLMFCCTVCFLSVKAFSLIMETDKKKSIWNANFVLFVCEMCNISNASGIASKISQREKVKNFN